jgi:hypothetical protein
MIPRDDFTPHGYLDNPYHSWKLNPDGVIRSLPPLGMGWHVPNLGSYVRNQFQYTAHLNIGLQINNDLLLITPEDFQQHGCVINSPLHTKNRFEYNCIVPAYGLLLRARYFLIHEHALGCILSFTTTRDEPLSITCYLLHQHTHNPFTSRLWEHGLYARVLPGGNHAMLGIASEGDVFIHGWQIADTGPAPVSGTMGYSLSPAELAARLRGKEIPPPGVTQADAESGWQIRTVALPCTLLISGSVEERRLHVVLARGVSLDQSYAHWRDGLEGLTAAEEAHRREDEDFWRQAPQLGGDWPASWRRGFVYDQETLRMVIRPPCGVIEQYWDGMQIQAPRMVLAEAALDCLSLSYAAPELAATVLLGHFTQGPHANLPCMREDGSYNMVADDGQICGTAPSWGFPLYCCDLLFRRTGDRRWLRRLYPAAAAYLRWWLEHRRDLEGWLVYACSWESGQDVSSRFGPQQTGGTLIQHVRPVDLQASMAQGAAILARWAESLAQEEQAGESDSEHGSGNHSRGQPEQRQHGEQSSERQAIDFQAEASQWEQVAAEFTVKTRLMWQQGWFRDYDTLSQEWSSQEDAMHLAALFCGAAGWGHSEQLRSALRHPPNHSRHWAPLCWPPVALTVIGAAANAGLAEEAAELAYQFIDGSYRDLDRRPRTIDDGLPGITREYRQAIARGERLDYVNAGIEGYGWGALSIHLLLRYLLGLREEEAGTLTLAPMLPQALRRPGATYYIGPLQWGTHTLEVTCHVEDSQQYSLRLICRPRGGIQGETIQWERQGHWGEQHALRLTPGPSSEA